MARNDSCGVRYKNCLSDGTAFMFNIQTNEMVLVTDMMAINKCQNVAIQIKGQSIYTSY